MSARALASFAIAAALGSALAGSTGCASEGAPAPAPAAEARVRERETPRDIEAALSALEEDGEVEPRVLEPVARRLAQMPSPLPAREAALARVVGRDLCARIGKRREWGAPQQAQREDLLVAARAAALAPELLDAQDLAPFAQELLAQRDPRSVERFIEAWTSLGLPRTAAASDAIVRALSSQFPLDGLLESLFARGFRLEDAALCAYAERALEARYDAQDLLFVLERTSAKDLAAKLPAFAERLLSWVDDRPEGPGRDPALARRIFHNAVLALVAAERAQVTLPAALFERHIRPAAARADLDVDDLAEAFQLYAHRTDELLEGRLDALARARATPAAVTELLEVAALLHELDHPRAEDAVLLARLRLERPAGIDEALTSRPRGDGYDPEAVRRLYDRVTPALASAHRARIYLDLVASLAHEQGEQGIAARLDGVRLVKK